MANRSYGSLKYGSDEPLTSGVVTLLAAMTTSNTRNDVLDLLRDLYRAERAVGGHASSTLN